MQSTTDAGLTNRGATMIQYNETYEIVTPESAEEGEAHDAGFIDTSIEASFSELVELLAGAEPSCYPVDEIDSSFIWYNQRDTNEGTRDWYELGHHESRSYHPVTDRDARYMLKAWKLANKR